MPESRTSPRRILAVRRQRRALALRVWGASLQCVDDMGLAPRPGDNAG